MKSKVQTTEDYSNRPCSSCMLSTKYEDMLVCGATSLLRYKSQEGILYVSGISSRVKCPGQLTSRELRESKKKLKWREE